MKLVTTTTGYVIINNVKTKIIAHYNFVIDYINYNETTDGYFAGYIITNNWDVFFKIHENNIISKHRDEMKSDKKNFFKRIEKMDENEFFREFALYFV